MKPMPLIAAIAFVILSACSSVKHEHYTYDEYHGDVGISNKSMSIVNGFANRTEITSKFNTDTTYGNKGDGGEVIVAGHTLEKRVLGERTHYHISTSTTTTDGVFASINISGQGANGFPAIVDSVYVPKVFEFTSPTYNEAARDYVASRSSGLTLKWNADKNVESVEMSMHYIKAGDTTNFGDWPNRYWWAETDDDGSYTIPSSVFKEFTANHAVRLIVRREVTRNVNVGNKKLIVRGGSTATFWLSLRD